MTEELSQIVKMQFEYAQDVCRHLMTLAGASLAFSVTFHKDIVRIEHTRHRWMMITACLLHLLSIGFGLLGILALTGRLLEPIDPENPIGYGVRIFTATQIGTFFDASLLLVFYYLLALPGATKDHTTGKGFKRTPEYGVSSG